MTVALVLGHEGAILQEAHNARNVTVVLSHPLCGSLTENRAKHVRQRVAATFDEKAGLLRRY